MSAGLDGLVVSIFTNNIKIMTSKKIKMIKQVELKFNLAFLIVNIVMTSFYLGLKILSN